MKKLAPPALSGGFFHDSVTMAQQFIHSFLLFAQIPKNSQGTAKENLKIL